MAEEKDVRKAKTYSAETYSNSHAPKQPMPLPSYNQLSAENSMPLSTLQKGTAGEKG